MNSENLENQGQVTGQDETVDAKENSWEKQAKFFQSEKDKLFEENKNLKKFEKLGKVLQSRPDILEDVRDKLKTPPGQPELKKPENFDPWEAYNDPKSESYKYRMQEIDNTINQKVQKQVEASTSQIVAEQGVSKLKEELRNRGMQENDINGFIEFANKEPDEFDIDGYIKMYQAYSSTEPNSETAPLNHIRQTQNSPAVGGVLNGNLPQNKSDDDAMWEGVVGATKVGNKLP